MIIGLTGGVGSGKSAVAGILRELGAAIVGLDEIGHELLDVPEVKDELRDAFSSGIFRTAASESISRKRLGKLVFGDPREIERLNAIMHPRMRDRVAARVEKHRASGTGVMVVEGALLYELDLAKLCDTVWLVDAPREMRFKRAENAHGWPEGDAARREAMQRRVEDKRQSADTVIDNSGDHNKLEERVRSLWEEIQHG